MPELPEIETVRRTLDRQLRGRTIVSTRVREPRLRWPLDRDRFEREVSDVGIVGLRRRAKYLQLDLAGGRVLLVHLGMSGRFSIMEGNKPLERHDHVIFCLDDGRELRLNDARRFGSLDLYARAHEDDHVRLLHLGVEPLSERFHANYMQALAHGSRKPIKNFLMDATKVVGVGNIYANEALYVARIHPARSAGRISRARWVTLVGATRSVLSDAIENGGTTLRDFLNGDGSPGHYGQRLRVYGREGDLCARDQRTIRCIRVGGRSTFYCPGCQR